MFYILFSLSLLNVEVMGQRKVHNYTIDTRKVYSPGYVCNYESYFVSYPQFVLYTCVHESKCKRGTKGSHVMRRPELNFDNCPYTFHPPPEGGTYTCCHPEENEDTKHNPNATLAPLQTRYMPGFRSAFKCNDYAQLVCFDDQFCSQSSRRFYPSSYIKGGKDTDIGKYPHLALIGWHNPRGHMQNWFCLGTIVTERFILSAASCRDDYAFQFAEVVRVGVELLCELGIDCAVDPQYAQVITIDKLYIHPANDRGYFYHDIMLIKVKEDIKFNSKVRPACLFTEMNTIQSEGMFAMYEEKLVNGKKEETIHELEVEVFDKQSCSNWYKWNIRMADQPAEIDPAIMFCAGHRQNTNPCTDDYGGPIQIMEEVPYCMWKVFGVMAWSLKFQCMGSLPPMFTRVSYYLDWIEEIIWYDFNLLIEQDTCSGRCRVALKYPAVDEGRCRNI